MTKDDASTALSRIAAYLRGEHQAMLRRKLPAHVKAQHTIELRQNLETLTLALVVINATPEPNVEAIDCTPPWE